jgi:cysteine desulfurase
MRPPPIDLDHNASSPADPRVVEAMRPHWLAGGNPESRHALGRAARRALDSAREAVARVLDADPAEVVFTSGGTEANNLAVLGLADPEGDRRPAGPPHLVCSPIEHPAVAAPVESLERRGFAVDRPAVGPDGVADAEMMAAALRPGSRLAALMLANNETGAIQPVARLAGLASALGVPVHTDAAQALGRIAVSFRALGVATLAASGHKFGGPVGSGLLVVRRGVRLAPTLLGGGQQGGVRPGTPAVALAVGLAEALRLWDAERQARTARWRRLRDRLESGLVAALGADRVVRNGPADEATRLPQTVNLGFPGLDGDALLIALDLAGVAASLGSACASGSTRPSPTLEAMRVPAGRLRSSVRFSLGPSTAEADIDEAVRRVAGAVARLDAADA